MVSSGGLETVSSGGTSFSATVSSGGTEKVLSGGTEIGATVSAGGTQAVSGGGDVSATTVSSGGTVSVGSGGTAVSATIDPSGGLAVGSGGTAISSTLSGGSETVASGGTAISATVSSGGTEVISGGGTLDGATVSSGGTLILSSGGSAGAPIMVGAGGTAILDGNNGTGPFSFSPGSGGVIVVSGGGTSVPVISSFASGGSPPDIVALPGVGSGSATVVTSGGTSVITVTSGGSVVETIDVVGVPGSLVTSGGNTYYEACFGRGTRLATSTGEIAVEDLVAGDLVTTLEGPKPVRWIGHRRVDLSPAEFEALKASALRDTASGPGAARNSAELAEQMPIRIARGAIAENVPHRDLLVSPEHAVYIAGVLVPTRHLVNGATIAHVTTLRSFQYFHVELESHGVLLSEGLTTESWLDTGNRGAFENAEEAVIPHPLFAAQTADKAWATMACAELVTSGAKLAAIREGLIASAVASGAMTREADVRLAVDGVEVGATSVAGGRHVFAVPAGAKSVAIVSRSARGCDALGDPSEQRRLGVAISAIRLKSEKGERPLFLADPALRDGFSYCEGAAEAPFRWTNGYAVLPAFLMAGFEDGFDLIVDIAGTVAYPAVEADSAAEWSEAQQAG